MIVGILAEKAFLGRSLAMSTVSFSKIFAAFKSVEDAAMLLSVKAKGTEFNPPEILLDVWGAGGKNATTHLKTSRRIE